MPLQLRVVIHVLTGKCHHLRGFWIESVQNDENSDPMHVVGLIAVWHRYKA